MNLTQTQKQHLDTILKSYLTSLRVDPTGRHIVVWDLTLHLNKELSNEQFRPLLLFTESVEESWLHTRLRYLVRTMPRKPLDVPYKDFDGVTVCPTRSAAGAWPLPMF